MPYSEQMVWNATRIGIGLTVPHTRRREITKLAMLSIVSVLLALIGLEYGLRTIYRLFPLNRPDFKRAPILYEFQRSTQYHPEWGWSFLPEIDAIWEEDWKHRERSNIRISFKTIAIPGYPQYGMRDDGLDQEANTVVPIFGDSFTFGSTVELEEIWAERIEQRNPGVDMLNLASGGGLTKAVEQYKILGDLLPPHDTMIYAMWLGNEFLDNYVFPKDQRDFDELQRAHLSTTNKRRLQAASYLAYIGIEAFDNINKNLSPPEVDLTYSPETDQLWDEQFGNFYLYPTNPILLRYAEPEYTDERIDEGIRNTEAAMLAMKTLAGDRRLIFLLLPFKAQLHEEIIMPRRPELDLAKPNTEVLAMCERQQVTCIDLLPELVLYKDEKLFWDYDPHFTPAGQRYASIVIENRLRDIEILP